MRIRRRDFLKGAAAGAGGLALGIRPRWTVAAEAKTFDPCEAVPLGKTGIKLSRVGLGTGMKGGMRQSNQTKLGQKGFEALMKGAYDRGVRWFDLADMYGSHQLFAGSLSGIARDKYVLVSKIWLHQRGLPEPERPDVDVVVQRFLKELKTDHIDLVLMHCMWYDDWQKRFRKQMDALAKLKEKGLIRAHGVSCHSLPALTIASTEPWVDSIHTRINPYGTKMDGPPSKVVPVLKQAHANGKGVVGMKIIGEGAFRDSDEARDNSVKYVLGLGCVDTMVVGFEKTAEIDDLAARVRKVPKAVKRS